MLSKSAALLAGLIHKRPLNAYEIVKQLHAMNVRWWFNVGDSTVYATLKTMEKRGIVSGVTEKAGNMPDRTVYTLTEAGEAALQDTLKAFILQFDYDATAFSIAAFLLDVFPPEERQALLEQRLAMLERCRAGLAQQLTAAWERETPAFHAANVRRMMDLVDAELCGCRRLLACCTQEP